MRPWLPISLAAIMGLGFFSCSKMAGPGPQNKAAKGDEPVPVKIASVIKKEMPLQIPAVGAVEPIESVQVKPQVSGPVVKVFFTEGDMVKEGQELFEIDKRPFEVTLRQAHANLAKSEAQLEQAKASLARDTAEANNAKVVLERDKMLFDKKMVSPEEYDKSKTDVEALKAVVAADDANVKSTAQAIGVAKADIDQAALELEYTTVRAPISGRTGGVMVKEGNLVRGNDSTAMVIINQLAPIYVTFSVPEKYLADIRNYFQKGPVTVAATPKEGGTSSSGALSFIDNAVKKGTIALKAKFDNQDGALWPGQFAEVVLRMAVRSDAVVVPSRAVQTGQQGTYVYVVTQDTKADFRKVTVGDSVDGMTIIEDGLAPDEKVVTDGHLRVRPGSPLKIAPDEPAAGAAK
jgi:multidrug efflux system membrane fusion protein